MDPTTLNPTVSAYLQLALKNSLESSNIESQGCPLTSLLYLITIYFFQLVARHSRSAEPMMTPMICASADESCEQREAENIRVQSHCSQFSTQHSLAHGTWAPSQQHNSSLSYEAGVMPLAASPTYTAPLLTPSDLFGVQESYQPAVGDLYSHTSLIQGKVGSQTDGHSVFWCDYRGCSRMFCSRTSLLRHRMCHGQKLPYPCEYPHCTRQFHYRSELVRHQLTHNRKSRSNHQASSIHSKHVTGEPAVEECTEHQYICDQADGRERFDANIAFSRHRQVHKTKKERTAFVCSYPDCNRTFLRQYNMEEHMNTHTGARPHKCRFPGCNKRFRQRSALCHHKTVHRDRLNQMCPSRPGCQRTGYTHLGQRHRVNVTLQTTSQEEQVS